MEPVNISIEVAFRELAAENEWRRSRMLIMAQQLQSSDAVIEELKSDLEKCRAALANNDIEPVEE